MVAGPASTYHMYSTKKTMSSQRNEHSDQVAVLPSPGAMTKTRNIEGHQTHWREYVAGDDAMDWGTRDGDEKWDEERKAWFVGAVEL